MHTTPSQEASNCRFTIIVFYFYRIRGVLKENRRKAYTAVGEPVAACISNFLK